MNLLIHESSPYLLQHARNPVHWQAWNDQSLQKAKIENKPIILSIGYAACHWCHVMEHESFENEQIATIMNRYFICIKVDREERPDVDALYMEALHAMGLQGGWPLNVFLLPNQQPFYGGTYFQPRQWANILLGIADAFQHKYDQLDSSAQNFTKHLQTSEIQQFLGKSNSILSNELLRKTFEKIAKNFDTEHGGQLRVPKFPMPALWGYALKFGMLQRQEKIIKHTLFTLEKIANGGIYDHLAGGFARYSTDAEWFCPHFEKMLYDNAQLLSLYAECYAISGNLLFKQKIEETITWLSSDMTSPDGGFYAAIDADSEGEEGRFYVWNKQEIENILGNDAAWFCQYFQVTNAGNWEGKKNILCVISTWEQFAAEQNIALSALDRAKKIMLDARKKRISPCLDDKILCSWNALVIKGLCDAYRYLGNEDFLMMAQKNATFIEEKFWNGKTLFHSYKNDRASINGFLEDYATTADAFVTLYQVTFQENYLAFAELLAIKAFEFFWDDAESLFYFTDTNELIARKKEILDNVIPSSNAIMAQVFFNLGKILSNTNYAEIAQLMQMSMQNAVQQYPESFSAWAGLAIQTASNNFYEIAIIGNNAEGIRKEMQRTFIPNAIFVGSTHSNNVLPILNQRYVPEKTLVYVCHNQTCRLPVQTAQEALAILV